VRRINEVDFASSVKPNLSFEIMRFSKLLSRVLPHPVYAPTRFRFHLVYYVLSGRTNHSIDFSAAPIRAGDLVFLAPGRVQQYEQAPGLEMVMLLFTPEFLSSAFDARDGDPLRGARVLSTFLTPPVLHVPKPERAELEQLIGQLEREYTRDTDAVQPALLSALLKAFLLRAERLATEYAAKEPARMPSELATFREQLEAGFERHRSVKLYARQVGVTPRKLTALTQGAFGRSAKAFVDERVVLELKRSLAHTDASVKSLAARFTFGEPTNLVKFFKLHTGETPLQFRERFRVG
jgi:AraC family transcriptional regulator, transcriptional activator of pobA